MMTTWREEITRALEDEGESWSDVVATTLSEAALDKQFDSGYGTSRGARFTLWTARRVYFPAVYDGAEWVASVPRNPSVLGDPRHVGGQ